MTMTMGYKAAHLAVIVQWQMLTKMRFKQGTGDPCGFKHFLHRSLKYKARGFYLICRKSIQCLILFTGNIFVKIKERLLYYLQNMLLQKQFEV